VSVRGMHLRVNLRQVPNTLPRLTMTLIARLCSCPRPFVQWRCPIFPTLSRS
jgi:hypothetical protein